MNESLPIFVYGTLKRGEERASRWPHPPLRIERATIAGQIRDLGPYPALIDGESTVVGELWHMRDEHLAGTLRVLDEIECFGNDDIDLYVRRVVWCQTPTGQRYRAYTYYLANPTMAEQMPVVPPNADGHLEWKGRRREG